MDREEPGPWTDGSRAVRDSPTSGCVSDEAKSDTVNSWARSVDSRQEMESLEFKAPAGLSRGLSLFFSLATVGWTVVVAAAIIDGAPWAAAFFAALVIGSAMAAVGTRRARKDPAVRYRLDDVGLEAFGGRGARIEAWLLRTRLGSVRWSDLVEVRTRAARYDLGLEFVSADRSRPVLVRPELIGISAPVFVVACRRRAARAGARVAWPHDEAFKPRLRLRHRPGRRSWLPPTIIRGRDGSVGLGYSAMGAARLAMIAVGFVIVGAFLSVHQETAPFSPRAATIFAVVASIVAVTGVMSLARVRLRVGPLGLEMDRPFRKKDVYPWKDLAEVRWSELGHHLAVSTGDGRHHVLDVSMYAGATERQALREMLLLCEEHGVSTAVDDPA